MLGVVSQTRDFGNRNLGPHANSLKGLKHKKEKKKLKHSFIGCQWKYHYFIHIVTFWPI